LRFLLLTDLGNILVVILTFAFCSVSAVSIFYFLNWIWEKEDKRLKRAFDKRLLDPNFAALEEHFHHPMPQAIRLLHKDREKLTSTPFYVAASVDAPEENRWGIEHFLPADLLTVSDVPGGCKGYLPFAIETDGCIYLIDPTQDDPSVLLFDCWTEDITTVADHLSNFLTWPRLEQTD
jgi:hypothetical protein